MTSAALSRARAPRCGLYTAVRSGKRSMSSFMTPLSSILTQSMSKELGADHVINATETDPVEAIRELTGGNGADIVFECAGGSPKQGLAGVKSLMQAIDAVRSGGKIIGVSWFGSPLEFDIDILRERSLRYLFPDISTLEHLEHTVRLVASGRVRLKPTITHTLEGIEQVPMAFEITANARADQ